MFTRDGQEILAVRLRSDGVRNLGGMLMPSAVLVKEDDFIGTEYQQYRQYTRSLR